MAVVENRVPLNKSGGDEKIDIEGRNMHKECAVKERHASCHDQSCVVDMRQCTGLDK